MKASVGAVEAARKPKRIPISTAKRVADENELRQVILLAWDGELTHIVTYGKSADDCAQAAQGGNYLKEKWGWPECNDQPSRVKKLQTQLAESSTQVSELRRVLKEISEQDPVGEGICGPKAPEYCEVGCCGCKARAVLEGKG